MNKLIKYIQISLLIVGLSACTDMLDKKPLTEISEEDLWNDPALVEGYVNSRYNQVGHGWTEGMQSSCVDETDLVWGARGCEPIIFGYMSPTDLGRMNGGWWGWDNRSWGTKWANISSCNIFFERIDEVPFTDEDLRARLKGEVRFIRAFEYNDLIIRWGAVPLITKSYTVNDVDEIVQVKRATYKECVDFLVSELEQAAQELPASFTGDNYGRATSVAARALKARILLYAASPLMNEDVKIEQVGYLSPEANRWQKAADAAREAINEALDNGYALFNNYSDPTENYQNIFLDASSGNKEVLFARMGTASNLGENLASLEQWNYSNGFGGWGGNCPIQELVDDYEMTDGSDFDWNNSTHAASPYENRDPRFYATVLYDGATFRDRTLETYYEVDANGKETGGGKDTKYGVENWNASSTGYNLRKFINESYVGNSWNFNFSKNWIWLRLAEQYLNLAEALYFTGDEAGARQAVNVIRQRAAMPDITSSGTQLLEDIKHERRIELVMEEHRFYDVRRWKEGDKYFNRTVHGINVFKYPDGRKVYEICDLKGSVSGERTFNDKIYWTPILKSEIDKNPNLVQNPGY